MFSVSLSFLEDLEDLDETEEIEGDREIEGSSVSFVRPQERRRESRDAFGILGRGGTSSEASPCSRCGEDALFG